MVQAGDLGMVEYLLDCGASPNPSIIAHTALRAASIFGHEHVARRLLEEQGDPNFCSLFGRTPLMGAAMNTHPALVRVLLEAKVRTESAVRACVTLGQITPNHHHHHGIHTIMSSTLSTIDMH